MNILFVLPYVPSRIRVRPFHLIQELSKKHNVYIVCLSDGSNKSNKKEILKYAKDLCVINHSKAIGYLQAILSIFTPIPSSVAFCWSKRAKDAILYTTQNQIFDVIHIEHLRAVSLMPKDIHAPIVFDSVDCLTDLFMQMAIVKKNPMSKFTALVESLKLRLYEPQCIKHFKKIIITSVNDKKKMKKLNSKLVIDVVSNGVDTNYFKPESVEKKPHRIVFNGKMNYAPNAIAVRWFAKKVFPSIKNAFPDAEFFIVGSSPPECVKALQKQDGITVTGFVDDLRPYLNEASIAVVPMQIAVGVQNKLMEAMAMGLPVVSTSISTLGKNIPGVIVEDNPKDMADKICTLLGDQESLSSLGKAAREFACEQFSWENSAAKLETIYYKITGKD